MRWGLLAVIQLGLIAVPLAERLDVQMTGETVPLAVAPVDPRDLLRGDYVVINLAISEISKDVPGAAGVTPGEQVYVGLADHGKNPATPVSVTRARAEAGDLAIAGKVVSVRRDHIRVDYGIDAFFLPEGDGKDIENQPRGRMTLEVALAKDGRSLPVTLEAGDKTYRSDALF
ncbi:hypothetical protein E1297_28195 [Roseibium sp. RKSG952]|nr:hypothetical protein [Roseibium sp. RKSG952]